MKIIKGLIIFLLPSIALAAGGGEHHVASIKDLLWPAVNFTLLFGFMAYKLKKPIAKSFTNNAIKVEEEYKDAGRLSIESEEKITSITAKLQEFDKVKDGIVQSMHDELASFATQTESETKIQMEKTVENGKQKILFEKNRIMSSLNEELVDQVITSLKDKLNDNPELKKQVTDKLISGLK